MPIFTSSITDFVAGDSLMITRTVSNVDPTDGIVKAYLTVKRNPTDADLSAIFQKTITTVAVVGQGQITATGATGAGDGTAALSFEWTAANTALLTGFAYWFDIQCITSSAAIYTPEKGLVLPTSEITKATT